MTRVEARTGALDWSVVGGGPDRTLVMVHALGADRAMWASQLPALSSTHRVVLLDLPGHGNSSAVPGDYTISDLGLDVLDVATAAGAGEFDLCGLSLGGLISLWIAVEVPDRVTSLVVSNTAARVGSEELWMARIEAVATGGMKAVQEMAVARYFTSDLAVVDPGTVERAVQVLVATDPTGYIGCCAALRDADLRESVEAIRCPTLIIGADRDISTPPEETAWLQEHIAGSTLLVVEDAAHFANLEQPEAWTAGVAGFLAH